MCSNYLEANLRSSTTKSLVVAAMFWVLSYQPSKTSVHLEARHHCSDLTCISAFLPQHEYSMRSSTANEQMKLFEAQEVARGEEGRLPYVWQKKRTPKGKQWRISCSS